MTDITSKELSELPPQMLVGYLAKLIMDYGFNSHEAGHAGLDACDYEVIDDIAEQIDVVKSELLRRLSNDP